MLRILGKYKSYSPVVLSFILIAGMILILVFESFGLARKEVNLSLRMAGSIEIAEYNIEKSRRPNEEKILETQKRILAKINRSSTKIKPNNSHTIVNILYNSILNEEDECQGSSCYLDFQGNEQPNSRLE